jgi:hypothetical protein
MELRDLPVSASAMSAAEIETGRARRARMLLLKRPIKRVRIKITARAANPAEIPRFLIPRSIEGEESKTRLISASLEKRPELSSTTFFMSRESRTGSAPERRYISRAVCSLF